jgi:hypothetical protein
MRFPNYCCTLIAKRDIAPAPGSPISSGVSEPKAKSKYADIHFAAVSLFRKYYNKGNGMRMSNRASTRSLSFIRPCLVIGGMRRTTPVMKTLLQVVMLIMTCLLPTAMSLAESVCVFSSVSVPVSISSC